MISPRRAVRVDRHSAFEEERRGAGWQGENPDWTDGKKRACRILADPPQAFRRVADELADATGRPADRRLCERAIQRLERRAIEVAARRQAVVSLEILERRLRPFSEVAALVLGRAGWAFPREANHGG